MSDGIQEFGALLRRFRTDRLLTMEGLAQASGVSVRGIGDLERGRRAPRSGARWPPSRPGCD
ncbi:helix-turn-helix domain-containing protein [Streptomyces canarius]